MESERNQKLLQTMQAACDELNKLNPNEELMRTMKELADLVMEDALYSDIDNVSQSVQAGILSEEKAQELIDKSLDIHNEYKASQPSEKQERTHIYDVDGTIIWLE